MQRQYQNDIEIIIDREDNPIQQQPRIRVREQYVKIYEIDQYRIDQSLNFIAKFFEIIKTFATRSHAHLKVLVNLVNNLIISEDYVHLIDETLRVNRRLKFPNINSNENQQQKQQSVAQQTPNELEQTQPLKNYINNQNKELTTLLDAIKRGEDDTNYLKECISQLVDKFNQMNNEKNNFDDNLQKINIHNQVQMPENDRDQLEGDLFDQKRMYDKFRKTEDIKNISYISDYNQGYYTERGNDPYKRQSYNRQSFSNMLNLQNELKAKEFELQQLKDDLKDLENDIRQSKQQANHYKDQYQQQLDENIKMQRLQREKDQLEEKLTELREKNNEQERTIRQKQNKIQEVQDQLNQKILSAPQIYDTDKQPYNKQQSLKNKNLEKELDKVKKQLDRQKNKNKELESIIKNIQEINIQKVNDEQQDVTDLLKCLFIQGNFIDEELFYEQQYQDQQNVVDQYSQNVKEYDDSQQEQSDENEEQNDSGYYDEDDEDQLVEQDEDEFQDELDNNEIEDNNNQKEGNEQPGITVTQPKDSNIYKSDLNQIQHGEAREVEELVDEDSELMFKKFTDPDKIVKRIDTGDDNSLI